MEENREELARCVVLAILNTDLDALEKVYPRYGDNTIEIAQGLTPLQYAIDLYCSLDKADIKTLPGVQEAKKSLHEGILRGCESGMEAVTGGFPSRDMRRRVAKIIKPGVRAIKKGWKKEANRTVETAIAESIELPKAREDFLKVIDYFLDHPTVPPDLDAAKPVDLLTMMALLDNVVIAQRLIKKGMRISYQAVEYVVDVKSLRVLHLFLDSDPSLSNIALACAVNLNSYQTIVWLKENDMFSVISPEVLYPSVMRALTKKLVGIVKILVNPQTVFVELESGEHLLYLPIFMGMPDMLEHFLTVNKESFPQTVLECALRIPFNKKAKTCEKVKELLCFYCLDRVRLNNYDRSIFLEQNYKQHIQAYEASKKEELSLPSAGKTQSARAYLREQGRGIPPLPVAIEEVVAHTFLPPPQRHEWFDGKIISENVKQIRGQPNCFVYFDKKAILADGCSEELWNSFLGVEAIFDAGHYKQLKPQVMLADKTKLTHEVWLEGQKDRIFLSPMAKSATGATLYCGIIYRAKGLHDASDLRELLARKPVALNLSETQCIESPKI